MKTACLTFIAVIAFANNGICEAPPDDVVKKLTAAIRKHCPDAEFAVTKDEFLAKKSTLKFTIHGSSMDGEISSQTYQEEGPNYKGFIVRVSLYDGRYDGQAAVPQTLREPYFRTFIDAPMTVDGKQHYAISFSYGSRLDEKLKKAILDALPKIRIPEIEGPAK